MRTIIFLGLFMFGFSAGYAQQINEEFDKTPLKDVLTLFENKYGITLAYDPELIKDVSISTQLENVTIDEALSTILEYSQLSFKKVKNNYYTIQPSSKEWAFTIKMVDEKGEGIPYGKVRILGTYLGAYAGEDGTLKFAYKSDKPPVLEFSSIGFIDQTIPADQIQNNSNISMKTEVLEFETVVVEYLTEGISTSEDVSSISVLPKKIAAVPGTTEPDVFQLVQNIPGINSASSTVSEIQIRGGTSDQNHLLWDGIPIYHPGHFNGMISSVNPNIIEKAVLHRDVYDPYFGGKASGLIELNSLDYIPEKIETGAGINLIQGDAYLKTNLGKKVGLLLSGRRSYMDLWTSPTYQRYADRVYQETEIENTGTYSDEPDFEGLEVAEYEVSNKFVYYDLNGKLIFKPNDKNLITLSSLLTRNSLSYSTLAIDDDEVNSNEIISSSTGLGLNYKKIWNKKVHSTFLAAFTQYSYRFLNELGHNPDSLVLEESLEKNNDLDHYELKWNTVFRPNLKHKVSAGLQLLYNNVNYTLATNNEEEQAVTETGSNDGFTTSLNLNYQFKTNRFLSKVGLRSSHYAPDSDFYFEPRIYTQYKLTDWLTAKAAFGLQNQFISQVDQFEEASLGLSNRIWVMAGGESEEDDIPVVKSNIISTGLSLQTKGWYIDVDAYYKQLTDIVNFSSNPELSSGLLRGDATAQGIDFLIKKRWKNFRSWISYSIGRVTYHFEDFDSEPFTAPFNQTHTFKWVNTLRWRQFEFSSSFKIASGKPYTPIANVIKTEAEDPDEVEEEELWKIVHGKMNSKTLPLFHQLDLTVFYSFPKNPDKGWKGKIGISCFNIYNQKNVLSRFYDLEVDLEDADNPMIETYAIDKYYLSITPNAVIRFEF